MNKTVSILILFIISVKGFSQIVKSEIIDYHKTFSEKKYSTLHYANASYSSLRPYLILITNKSSFSEIYNSISQKYNSKQEYTDIYLIGIEDFNPNNISEIDEELINNFINDIIKYRSTYLLPIENMKQLRSKVYFVSNEEQLCEYLLCR